MKGFELNVQGRWERIRRYLGRQNDALTMNYATILTTFFFFAHHFVFSQTMIDSGNEPGEKDMVNGEWRSTHDSYTGRWWRETSYKNIAIEIDYKKDFFIPLLELSCNRNCHGMEGEHDCSAAGCSGHADLGEGKIELSEEQENEFTKEIENNFSAAISAQIGVDNFGTFGSEIKSEQKITEKVRSSIKRALRVSAELKIIDHAPACHIDKFEGGLSFNVTIKGKIYIYFKWWYYVTDPGQPLIRADHGNKQWQKNDITSDVIAKIALNPGKRKNTCTCDDGKHSYVGFPWIDNEGFASSFTIPSTTEIFYVAEASFTPTNSMAKYFIMNKSGQLDEVFLNDEVDLSQSFGILMNFENSKYFITNRHFGNKEVKEADTVDKIELDNLPVIKSSSDAKKVAFRWYFDNHQSEIAAIDIGKSRHIKYFVFPRIKGDLPDEIELMINDKTHCKSRIEK